MRYDPQNAQSRIHQLVTWTCSSPDYVPCSTLWTVGDSDWRTLKPITYKFYRYILDMSSRLDHTRAALALHRTMNGLRFSEILLEQRFTPSILQRSLTFTSDESLLHRKATDIFGVPLSVHTPVLERQIARGNRDRGRHRSVVSAMVPSRIASVLQKGDCREIPHYAIPSTTSFDPRLPSEDASRT